MDPEAEAAYREASRRGLNSQPGLSLLRLAQGDVDAAPNTINAEMEQSSQQRVRSRMLPAYMKIIIPQNELNSAHMAADELAAIADQIQALFLQ